MESVVDTSVHRSQSRVVVDSPDGNIQCLSTYKNTNTPYADESSASEPLNPYSQILSLASVFISTLPSPPLARLTFPPPSSSIPLPVTAEGGLSEPWPDLRSQLSVDRPGTELDADDGGGFPPVLPVGLLDKKSSHSFGFPLEPPPVLGP